MKPDADLILAHIEKLQSEPWLGAARRWWPGHLFHFTDIKNAVQILTDGTLQCRAEVKRKGKLATDIASPTIISSTDHRWKKYARLYFRPRTPMQYRNEGFRPPNKRALGGAHCPVPVVLIFDAKKILMAEETCFSDGNLRSSGAKVGKDADFLASLPFEKIYHEGAFSPDKRDEIVFHRHAEVIVPKSLDLNSLKGICCRSQPEFETLVHLLPTGPRRKWLKKISASAKAMLFFQRWSYVTKVDLSDSGIALTFNPASETPGPFKARLEVEEMKTKVVYQCSDNDFYARGTRKFTLTNMKHPEHYIISFFLNDDLAYMNRYVAESELPF